MFTNRFILILVALSMLLVTLAVSQPFSKPPEPRRCSHGRCGRPAVCHGFSHPFLHCLGTSHASA